MKLIKTTMYILFYLNTFCIIPHITHIHYFYNTFYVIIYELFAIYKVSLDITNMFTHIFKVTFYINLNVNKWSWQEVNEKY